MKFARFFGLAAFAASVLMAGSSQAAFVPLPATLNSFVTPGGASNGNDTSVGAVALSNFSYTGSGSVPAPASSINLSNFGGALQIAAPFGAASPDAGDSLIGFTATSAAGIASITLTGNPAVTGTGIASITETFYTSPGGTVLGQILVTPTTLSQTFVFAQPLTSVYIVKDILYSGGSAGTAQISFVRQSFNVVPEPASVVMMGLGVVGVLGAARLRRKPAAV